MHLVTKFQVFVLLAAVGNMPIPAAMGGDTSNTAFTYQGQLKLAGAPLNNTADFEFMLWDAEAAGSPVGPLVPKDAVQVKNGLFQVKLDFGANALSGTRWLAISVRSPAGGGSFEPVLPRQQITSSPYSIQTRGIFVDDQGQVGIGTTQPTEALHIVHDQTSDEFGGILVENANPVTGEATVYLDLKNNAEGASNTFRL